MNILVIGNVGTFASVLKERFSARGIKFQFVDSSRFHADVEVREILSDHEFSKILYVSGETRCESRMQWLNFHLPCLILNYSFESDIPFVYLSSLSVFGWSDDVCTLSSPRNPLDTYGVTKNQFDQYVDSVRLKGFSDVCGLYPASLYSGNGRSSIERYGRVVSKFPFLRYVRFPGSLSYIDRDYLIERIIDFAGSSNYVDEILSKEKCISDYSTSSSLPLFRFPLIFLTFFARVIGFKRALILRMLFRGIVYK